MVVTSVRGNVPDLCYWLVEQDWCETLLEQLWGATGLVGKAWFAKLKAQCHGKKNNGM